MLPERRIEEGRPHIVMMGCPGRVDAAQRWVGQIWLKAVPMTGPWGEVQLPLRATAGLGLHTGGSM